MQGHQLEDHAVGSGHFRQSPAADEQGDVRRGNLVALEESEDAVLLARVDAVGAQGAPRPEEEFGGRERFGKAQGDEVFLVLQTGGDNEGHVELFAEDGVDEGHQGHLVKAHLDGVAGEVLAELFDDALGDGALDDDAGDLRYRQAALRLFLPWCRGISRRRGFGVFLGRAYGFGEGIDGEGAAGGGEGRCRQRQTEGGRCPTRPLRVARSHRGSRLPAPLSAASC